MSLIIIINFLHISRILDLILTGVFVLSEGFLILGVSTYHMNAAVDDVLSEFSERVDEVLDGRLDRVVLFGSYARGEELPGSDVDLLLIVDSHESGDQSKVADIAGEYFLTDDLILSPKIISKSELEEKQDFSFFQEIRNDGVTVYG